MTRSERLRQALDRAFRRTDRDGRRVHEQDHG
jgi:hypothetical protein